MCGIPHSSRATSTGELSPAACPVRACVMAEPGGDLPGQAMDRALEAHEWLSLALRLAHQPQHPQWEIVMGHLPQVGAGVGEADQDVGVADDVAQWAGTV